MKWLLLFFIFVGCLPSKPEQVAHKDRWVQQMAKTIALKYPELNYLNPESLKQQLSLEANGVILIDVRTEEERNISILPNALTLHHHLKEFSSSHLVYYCTNGARSSLEAKKALDQGFERVSVLSGGVLAWAYHEGAFIDSQGQATRQVHIFSKAWDFLPEDYHAITP